MTASVTPLFPLLKVEKPKKKRSYALNTSPLFDRAWKAYPASGRARQSRFEAHPIWVEIAEEVGEETLLACVVRYAREDKASVTYAPGFERFLRRGLWDNWMPVEGAMGNHIAEQFQDLTIRRACLARHGEAWVKSYLDRCTFEDGVIITKSATVFGVMSREPVFRELQTVVELRGA